MLLYQAGQQSIILWSNITAKSNIPIYNWNANPNLLSTNNKNNRNFDLKHFENVMWLILTSLSNTVKRFKISTNRGRFHKLIPITEIPNITQNTKSVLLPKMNRKTKLQNKLKKKTISSFFRLRGKKCLWNRAPKVWQNKIVLNVNLLDPSNSQFQKKANQFF